MPSRSTTVNAHEARAAAGPGHAAPVRRARRSAPCVAHTSMAPTSSKNSPCSQSSSTALVGAGVDVGRAPPVAADRERRDAAAVAARTSKRTPGPALDEVARTRDQPFAASHARSSATECTVASGASARETLRPVRAVGDRHGVGAGVARELEVVRRVADHQRARRGERAGAPSGAAACPDAASARPSSAQRVAWKRAASAFARQRAIEARARLAGRDRRAGSRRRRARRAAPARRRTAESRARARGSGGGSAPTARGWRSAGSAGATCASASASPSPIT